MNPLGKQVVASVLLIACRFLLRQADLEQHGFVNQLAVLSHPVNNVRNGLLGKPFSVHVYITVSLAHSFH